MVPVIESLMRKRDKFCISTCYHKGGNMMQRHCHHGFPFQGNDDLGFHVQSQSSIPGKNKSWKFGQAKSGGVLKCMLIADK